MKFSNSLVSLVALSVALAASSARANILTNGGFESGDFTGWTVADPGSGASVVTDSAANSGSYEALLGPSVSPMDLSQTFTLIPGFSTYYLSVWALGDSTDNTLQVIVDGAPLSTPFVVPGDGLSILYTQYIFPFTPAGPTTSTVTLEATDSTGSLRLDDADLEVPEPATLSVLGLGALALLGRKGRKAAKA